MYCLGMYITELSNCSANFSVSGTVNAVFPGGIYGVFFQ